MHSLFGLVTMLRFFSVLHIGIPLLAFRAGGGFLCPGGAVSSCTVGCGFALRWCVGAYGGWLACRVAQVCRGACVCD